MLRAMGLSLLLTELIELSAALLLKKREDIGLIALANLMTNPAVVYLSLLTKALRPGLYPAGGRRDGAFSCAGGGLRLQKARRQNSPPHAFFPVHERPLLWDGACDKADILRRYG